MGCDRFINRSGNGGQVMGTFGIQRIALRGPGCIDGTGRCQGVAGTGGRRHCCEEVAGTGDFRCDNILGTGGRHNHNNVAGTGGGRCRNEVAGTGGRNGHWDSCHWCLKTPTVVPR